MNAETSYNSSCAQFVVSTIGTDRPGLVAAMCEAITRHDGNIDDSTMTILGGQFAMLTLVSFPATEQAEAFRSTCATLAQTEALHIDISPLETPYPSPKALNPMKENAQLTATTHKFLLSVGGYDRTGITYTFSKVLADFNINITDVNAHRISGEEGTVYMLAIEMEAPAALEIEAFQKALNDLGKSMQLDVRLRSMDAVIL